MEVNGQVLSQGGNLDADRITDTTSRMQRRSNPGFLPAAVIVGLQPGMPLQVRFPLMLSHDLWWIPRHPETLKGVQTYGMLCVSKFLHNPKSVCTVEQLGKLTCCVKQKSLAFRD